MIDDEFLNYLDEMDKSLYTVINYNKRVAMNVLVKINGDYQRVSSSIFTELAADEFVLDQYEVLYGNFPERENEIALLIDEYNAIDAYILYYMGFDYEETDFYTFDDIVGTEYKLLSNDDYYEKIGDRYRSKTITQYRELYENAETTLKITAIMRVKPGASTQLYQPGLLYLPELTEKS